MGRTLRLGEAMMRNEARNASGFWGWLKKSALVGRRCRLHEWWGEGYSMMNPNPLLNVFSRRMAPAIFAVLLLTACSKTVQWEEEVPLNTGETILVKRSVEYVLQGGAGNPLDMAYRPVRGATVKFDWRGKQYRFDPHGSPVLLAISPQGYPVFVAEAEAGAWDAVNHYKCTIPFYVQFVPDATGRNWTWPPKVESWLYNLESNFLFELPKPDQDKRRYTVEERKSANAPGLARSLSRQKINPAYTGDRCRPKEK